MLDLHTATRKELVAWILQQQEQIAARRSEVGGSRAQVLAQAEELAQLRGGGGGGGKAVPAWVKPNRPKREKKERTRRSQGFARRREEPDEIQLHAAACCPECGRKLHGGWVHRHRQVIEIVPPQVRVIAHVMVARRCGICHRRVLPRVTSAELGVQGRRRFGVGVQALVAVLHGRYRIPLREVRRLLAEGSGLRISDGEIVALLDGVVAAGIRNCPAWKRRCGALRWSVRTRRGGAKTGRTGGCGPLPPPPFATSSIGIRAPARCRKRCWGKTSAGSSRATATPATID